MRINKYLASSGIGSRRGVEEYILEGKVKVNGKVIKDLAFDVNEEKDVVSFDGKPVNRITKPLYVLLNKPKGCVTTVHDEYNRKTVMDFLPESIRNIVVPIGRLDYDSEGLLLFSNNGDFVHKLTHPSSEIEKTYIVKVERALNRDEFQSLESGVVIDRKKTKPAVLSFLGQDKNLYRYEIKIREGRNRQVRKMFETTGREVKFLKRTQIGSLKLGGMSRGEAKMISEAEAYKALINEK